MHSHDHTSHAGHTHSLPRSATASRSIRRRLGAAVGITSTILIAELIAAAVSGSLALAADAGHMIVDSTGLLVALSAAHLATKPRTDARSWGFARAEVVAAGLQAGMLLVLTVLISYEAIERLISPTSIDAEPVLIVGIIGLIANSASILVLAGAREDNLNIRAAFLEVANDALGSLAVIVSAIIAQASGWVGADAIASLLIATLMVPRAWSLLRTSGSILLEEAPTGLDASDLRSRIEALEGVEDVHDLHVSTISTGIVTLTAHLGVSEAMSAHQRDALVRAIREDAATRLPVPIGHTTIEVEAVPREGTCALVHP